MNLEHAQRVVDHIVKQRQEGKAMTEAIVSTQPMHPVVRAALSANPDPATLRELLAVQREWEAGEAKKAYTRSMVALKRDLPKVIQRDATVDFMNKAGARTYYKHTTLAAMVDGITEPLTAHSFSLSWRPSTAQNQVTVTCRLTHSEGHFEECSIGAPPDTSGSKSTAQGVASTITLLSRYGALSLLGIATADMRDPSGEPLEEPLPKVSPHGEVIDGARYEPVELADEIISYIEAAETLIDLRCYWQGSGMANVAKYETLHPTDRKRVSTAFKRRERSLSKPARNLDAELAEKASDDL